MSYQVPIQNIDSTDDDRYFHSGSNSPMSQNNNQAKASSDDNNNTEEQLRRSTLPQEQHQSGFHQAGSTNALILTPDVFQSICENVTRQLMSQFQSMNLPNPVVPPPASVPAASIPIAPKAPAIDENKATKWPIWDGRACSFDAHAYNLRVKKEEDRHMLGSDRSICMSIFNSIPAEKQPRIFQWYQQGGPEKNHSWEAFLNHITDQHENKQARQTTRSELTRMRMGKNQHFHDFLQDFELKSTQCC